MCAQSATASTHNVCLIQISCHVDMLAADNIEGPSQHQHAANGEAVDSEAAKVAETATQQIAQGLKAVSDSLSGSKSQPKQSGIAAIGDC